MADSDRALEAQVAALVGWSREVGSALRRLDPTQSRVLRMMYFERRSQNQVAAELKMSPRAVSRALAAGMQALSLLLLASAAE